MTRIVRIENRPQEQIQFEEDDQKAHAFCTFVWWFDRTYTMCNVCPCECVDETTHRHTHKHQLQMLHICCAVVTTDRWRRCRRWRCECRQSTRLWYFVVWIGSVCRCVARFPSRVSFLRCCFFFCFLIFIIIIPLPRIAFSKCTLARTQAQNKWIVLMRRGKPFYFLFNWIRARGSLCFGKKERKKMR